MCGNLSRGPAEQGKAENITHLESNAGGEGAGKMLSSEHIHALPKPLRLSRKMRDCHSLPPSRGCQDGWAEWRRRGNEEAPFNKGFAPVGK